MSTFLLGLVTGAGLVWAFMRRRDGYWREFNTRPRGSNPPPPGRKPEPPPAPPYSSAAIAWQAAEAQRVIDPFMGVPWGEGHTQRGNGHGGPSTPKPPIKPQTTVVLNCIPPLSAEDGRAIAAAVRAALAKQRGFRP